MYRFALITTDGEALGTVAFIRNTFTAGDLIPQARGRNLRVTAVIPPDRDDELPLLVVEPDT